MMFSYQNATVGKNSISIQSLGDLTIIIKYAKELSYKIMESVFKELSQPSKDQIKKNQESYITTLKKILEEKDRINTEIINLADFQYILKKSIISASRTDSQEFHKNMSLLVSLRMNNDNIELDRIIYNEAIEAIGRITTDQIKVITFLYLLNEKLNTSETEIEFTKLLKNCLLLIDFDKTSKNIGRLYDTGCVHNYISSFGRGDFLSIISTNLKGRLGKQKIEDILKKEDKNSDLKNIWAWPISRMSITQVGVAIAKMYHDSRMA